MGFMVLNTAQVGAHRIVVPRFDSAEDLSAMNELSNALRNLLPSETLDSVLKAIR